MLILQTDRKKGFKNIDKVNKLRNAKLRFKPRLIYPTLLDSFPFCFHSSVLFSQHLLGPKILKETLVYYNKYEK